MKPITATDIIKGQEKMKLLLDIDSAIANIQWAYAVHIPLLEKMRELVEREE